ncbi:MAG: DNA-directed RNA polymerase subunit alpha [bacterium]|nr:DNA-directed RNA polymerase subunit alpha [bacterium]
MEHIPLPTKFEFREGSKENETILTIEPLYPGYGLTIGNALRRVLLSSLVGGAVIAVKVKGVDHEFSTIPYVKEDVVDLLLNIKKLHFKIHTDETIRLTLRAKGEKAVTAADIETTSDVEVANLDALICTLTNKNAQLEMEFFVKRGRGYFPTEAREKEKLELGTIAIDALFSPIRNVGFSVENVRVGQMTNYNRVILTIETDGSISAEDAVRDASQLLVDHFSVLLGGEVSEEVSVSEETEDVEALLSQQEDSEEEKEVDETEKEPKKRGRPRKNA